ncbi:MAG: threonine synthase [Rhizobiaceae bacterium]|nr:threonine synthase [Rhizobiaceae bacterium]
MHYISTRGNAPRLSFPDVLVTGLAADGGLYVPEAWPVLSPAAIRGLRGKPYADIALAVMWPYVEGAIERAAFKRLIDEAYATFRHPAVCPLVQTGANEFVLELFHGPTLAFKDVAMQLIARLMDHVLAERDERATIVGATSGDTGGAAIEAFAGRDRTDMFILFPFGRVSPVQQRQMTGSSAANVRAIAIDGTFDDCQDMVKAMFNHQAFRQKVRLSGINSINWGRIMAQIVYYFSAALSLGAPDRPVSFTVPTGNFGDIFAGYAAKMMGMPIRQLIVATNDNDILARALSTGTYEMHEVIQTTSPSMDIQISSNFERLIFDAAGRDPQPVVAAMASLKQSRRFTLSAAVLGKMRAAGFDAGRAGMDEVAQTLSGVLAESGYLLDPHTATAVHVQRRLKAGDVPGVVLATAHPAKFPDAVKAATGVHPALPVWLSDLMARAERFDRLPNDQKMVEDFIGGKTRAA